MKCLSHKGERPGRRSLASLKCILLLQTLVALMARSARMSSTARRHHSPQHLLTQRQISGDQSSHVVIAILHCAVDRGVQP